MDKGFAPAKVNLALHVTGQGPDGYHHLDSLVVFAGAGDQLSATVSRDLTLSVAGPFAAGVPTDETNLVLRAARALREARGVTKGAAIRLLKHLPHGAGIGSGSSDAAAAIRLLAKLWEVEPLPHDAPEVLALGSDVPVCLQAPTPVRMRGRGERTEPLPRLPSLGLVLVNPGATLPTRDVFRALARKNNPPLPEPPEAKKPEDFAAWLKTLRNDLQAPAETLAPAVTEVLETLRKTPGVLAAVMSGSGATCVGVTRDAGVARNAARIIQLARQGWWVAPAPVLAA
ncbi:4-diphosphocytidyl-2-C-methyl-D-erythritol kinase [Rubellimicrobium mesophilum DSM 19309]|uniref:4-diphosphocytidyl-2-C-methyl-D-erythritol kinase n=1 Tax=Rubellimicrobium mesophilum DSM 19309 TaxID=442562 RepID=A0A017HR72_9RHOB|nr:4-(cytidine 5'-diphospho)-2-C-methyl-D-erythritol kinase [Rubellimicrobium mesophilum]EYD76876.1 4-diphosphocytidyl-2-C-methyl-D-erythritol kinase [Rubellimicrobium mesophilum DSM 19309]